MIEIDKAGKPKAIDWKAAKLLMKDPEKFKNILMDFKEKVDANDVNHSNFKKVKDEYITLEFFKPEIMEAKSKAAKGLCDWVINIMKYYVVI